ncbi:hypothetical protein Daus18300_012894 [Diaporthe australafricana]|uniref:Uncharacterized protein n=1 Tax=Diaporthe australafricana TaxID=127596 RepID=A0ABR3W161_9PEZI
MLITTVSAPVQPCQAKGGDDKSCPEEPSHSAGPLDTVRSDHAYHNGGYSKEFTIEQVIEESFVPEVPAYAKQKVEKIPEKLLARPPDNETWRRYLVRAHQLEPLLHLFENTPSVHIVGKTPNDKYYDVVICDSCVRCLQHVGCAFEFAPPTDGPLARWLSWAFRKVRLLLHRLRPWFCHIRCAFKLWSEDGSVGVAPTESIAPDEFVHVDSTDELVHVESSESHKPHEFVHVGPTESTESANSDETNEFVLIEHTNYSVSTESTEPFKTTKPVKYKDFVSVTGNVVFVELSDKVKKSLKKLHYDVSQPRQGKINVYGCSTAKEHAENRLVMNAMRAVSSGKHGKGLDRYYLSSIDYYNARSLSLAVAWAILLRDIMSSKQDVIRQFFRHCLFITLHTLKHPEMACNYGFASRTDSEWLSFFEEVSSASLNSRSKAGIQALPLLQAVFAFECDGAGPRSDALKREYLDHGHVEKLNCLFFDDTELEIVPFGVVEPALLERCLRQFKIFEDCGELDVALFTDNLDRVVPLRKLR